MAARLYPELVRNAVRYIENALKEEKYHTRRLVNFICLYAGDAEVECAIIKRAMADMNIQHKLNQVVMVDLDFVDMRAAQTNQAVKTRVNREIAPRKLVLTDFDGLNKLYTGMRQSETAFTICIAVHPASETYADQPANARAILDALGDADPNVQQVNRETPNASHMDKLMAVKGRKKRKQIGYFYKLWLCHFDKSLAVMWRDGSICTTHCKDAGYQSNRVAMSAPDYEFAHRLKPNRKNCRAE